MGSVVVDRFYAVASIEFSSISSISVMCLGSSAPMGTRNLRRVGLAPARNAMTPFS